MNPNDPFLFHHPNDSLSHPYHSPRRRNGSRVIVGSPSSSPTYGIYRKSLPISIDHTSAEQEREYLYQNYDMTHHRSLRLDLSPEVAYEAAEMGNRPRQGGSHRKHHSVGTRWLDSYSNPRDGLIDQCIPRSFPYDENDRGMYRSSPFADSESSRNTNIILTD